MKATALLQHTANFPLPELLEDEDTSTYVTLDIDSAHQVIELSVVVVASARRDYLRRRSRHTRDNPSVFDWVFRTEVG